ncbi:hypothetical protein [Streptomonospora wellingtoniae]|uniref:Uncharacterized protein n=1 Tax=Streptomonospora wellingtoniae TaxID=3075544 RepID=A0ABU2KV68_9ACTN|nr:hypothetical protein [Streptomonospora sp. DSM 45055]MDT0302948.1 hypothetical protein [Streptomonospora sp. DSM 45055]
MELTPDQRQQLIDQGWTPPVDVAGMLAAEQADYARTGRALGHGEGDTTPVYLLVQERTDVVFAIERGTYEGAVGEDGDGEAELLDDRPDDYRTTTYTVLDA